MLLKLFLLFTVVPTVELYLLVKIGQVIGAFETVFFVVLMGFIGAGVAKREGLGLLNQIQQDLMQGLPPADRLIEGLLVLLGGVLLITPGVLTDLVGLSILLPPVRRRLAPWLRRAITRRVMEKGGFSVQSQGMFFRVGTPRAPEAPEEEEQQRRFDHPVA